MYKKPLIIKNTEKDITEHILKFVEDIKPKLKNIEFLFKKYPMFNRENEVNYDLYFNYSAEHSRKATSTGVFPLYFNQERSVFTIIEDDEWVEKKSLFNVLKKAEEYFLSVSDK